MTARTGREYAEALKDDRTIWIGNEMVSVTEDPRLRGSVEGMAGYFDWQHKYADECLVDDPERPGEKMSASLIVPRKHEDLMIRHRGLERLARYSNGLLGRTPDYVNVVLAGHVARKDIWMRGDHDPIFHDRLVRFYREVVEGDLAMTHTIIHAAVDKSIGELEGMNKDLTLRVVDRTETGVIVRGGKVLGTLAPFADEIYVYPSAPIAPGCEEHALCFSIPLCTKGLIVVCRDHYGLQMDLADAPFSARFDEQDAYVIFDDVEVPYDRLFVDGNLDVYNAISAAVSPGNTLQQTAIRAMVKLEFAYDLCVEIAKVTNSQKKPEVAALLGEIYTYFSVTRSVIAAAEAKAHVWGTSGAFFCDGDIASLRCLMPGWMVRVNEIIKTLGSHNLLATPSLAAFDNPAIGPLLEKYLPGSNGMEARDRARIMRTAWDFAGSALGSRLELYEMFYLGSANRGKMVDHMIAQSNGQGGLVRGFLKESGAWIE